MKRIAIPALFLCVLSLLLSGCSFSREDLFGIASGTPDIHLVFTDDLRNFSFGSVDLYRMKTLQVTVENRGERTLIIGKIYSKNNDERSFILDTSNTASIVGAGDRTSITVSFKPTQIIAYQADICVESNDPDEGLLSVRLDGRGSGTGENVPVIQVFKGDTEIQNDLSIPVHDFGLVEIGSTAACSVSILNGGTADLYLSDAAVIAGGVDHFSLIAAGIPGNLPPGQAVPLHVEFAPLSASILSAKIEIRSDDPVNGSFSMIVKGTGHSDPMPDIEVSSGGREIPIGSAILDFGTATVGSTLSKELVIRNIGTGVLQIYLFEVVNGMGEFTASPQGPLSIAPGSAGTASIEFRPSGQGLKTAEIQIESNDADEATYFFNVMGEGVSAPQPDIGLRNLSTGADAAPETLAHDFGKVGIGLSSQVELSIENRGSDLLHLYDITIQGPGSFSLTGVPDIPPPLYTIQPGGSQSFCLRFDPTAKGKQEAVVSIDSSEPDPPEQPYVVYVRGEGSKTDAPEMLLKIGTKKYQNGKTYSFGDVNLGSYKRVTFEIHNTGKGTLSVSGVLLVEHEAFDFDHDFTDPLTIPAGGLRNLYVTFTPSDEGMRQTYLELSSNDLSQSPYRIKLRGEGED
jgi:hypothetical protein